MRTKASDSALWPVNRWSQTSTDLEPVARDDLGDGVVVEHVRDRQNIEVP